ncbi:phosphatidylglycerophosphatase A family protein [Terriglobus aquaticus]|uniref:Phosphatidylglycerophosphatase A n=1 Tax=Terriglobus aquaticus TaxID=940139 RepID=A0ABW9KLK5_9BACT|nr:phosphatidylglycerophosphatase A [Terriglobus aquaticus]
MPRLISRWSRPGEAASIPDAAHDRLVNEAVFAAGHLPGVKRTRWAWIAGTFFGCGMGRPGPGTYGSVAAALVWFLVMRRMPAPAIPLVTLGMAAAATAVGIPAATRVARESGRKDPQIVVIDEVAGQWLALVFSAPTVPLTLLGLLLFRIFDILKPPPVRALEKLPEGTGIVVDDLAAGGYALVVGMLLQLAWLYRHH